jgi:hypothetical protein
MGAFLAVIAVIAGIAVVGGVYFAPMIIAYRHRRFGYASAITILNLFFGWSIIGWFIALFIALDLPTKPTKAERDQLVAASEVTPLTTERAGELAGTVSRRAVGQGARFASGLARGFSTNRKTPTELRRDPPTQR